MTGEVTAGREAYIRCANRRRCKPVERYRHLQTRRSLVIFGPGPRAKGQENKTEEYHVLLLRAEDIVDLKLVIYRGAGSPEPTAPISVRRVSGSRVPLNSGRNAASV